LLCIVRWTVSRAALVAAQGITQLTSLGCGEPRFALVSRDDDPILEWIVSTDSASAQLLDGTSRITIFESTRDQSRAGIDQIRVSVIDQLVHISVSRGGVCALTAVLRRGEVRPVLYARTALLADLGIGGGCYEVLDGRATDV